MKKWISSAWSRVLVVQTRVPVDPWRALHMWGRTQMFIFCPYRSCSKLSSLSLFSTSNFLRIITNWFWGPKCFLLYWRSSSSSSAFFAYCWRENMQGVLWFVRWYSSGLAGGSYERENGSPPARLHLGFWLCIYLFDSKCTTPSYGSRSGLGWSDLTVSAAAIELKLNKIE